jgi:methionyl-tRNA formyltransferase
VHAGIAQGDGPAGAHLGGLIVACGAGAVQILVLQRDGKRPVPVADFLNGMTPPEILE